MNAQKLQEHRQWRRHRHIRKKVIGNTERPRLSISRSLKHIYCQIIDDTCVDKNGSRSGKTLVACCTLSPSMQEKLPKGAKFPKGGNILAATTIGEEIARLALEKGITKVVFDRGGYQYHGRIKALAEGARKGGLKF